MDLPKIQSRLQTLGLGSDESWVYLTLLRHGPQKAGRIAKMAEFSRSKTYRLLDNLVEEKMVRASAGQPTVYSAQDPEELFERRRLEVERDLRRVESLEKEILDPLRTIGGDRRDEPPPSWQVIEGRERIYDHLLSRLRRADTRVRVASNHAITTHLTPAVRDAWDLVRHRAAEDGVEVQALLHLDPGDEEPFADYQRTSGFQVRTIPTIEDVHFVVLDDREVVLWAIMDPSKRLRAAGDVAIWSDAPGIVTPLQLLFERLWSNANMAGRDP